MPPTRGAATKAREAAAAAVKREDNDSDTDMEEAEGGASEQVLDPKLAEQPDEEHTSPARKRGRSKKEESDDEGEEAKKKPKKDQPASNGAKYAGYHKPGQNAFNPKLKDDVTPLQDLRNALSKQGADPHAKKGASSGGNVIYWMRNKDLRLQDNRALSLASAAASSSKDRNLIAMHILSPEDFRLHDRSARRIDFILRNLRILQKELHEKYHVPLVVLTIDKRTDVVPTVFAKAKEWGATNVFGNVEYEVDELWRDAQIVRKGKEHGVHATFVDDLYVVPPGAVTTKDGRPHSVFSPWNRAWTDYIDKHRDILEQHPDPTPNDEAVSKDSKLGALFKESGIPDSIEGFACKDAEYMSKLWPAGEEAAWTVLRNFFKGKGGLTMLDEPATAENTPHVKSDEAQRKKTGGEESRLSRYGTGRNLMNENGTSHLSPYLAAGIISARACLRATREVTGGKLHVGRDSGPAMWNTEVAFRDFYGHVLAAWPRVCMGRAYVLKYEDVIWERDAEALQAWKDGKTGYPIVDASMRQCAKQGYMHNRGRMIAAMFLTKHLMTDWREGEKWFMQNFIDGDFASNNGGWQWSASTGTDPQPYFRIFNPLSQSEKSDADGEYIRHWVPELRKVKGSAIHAPHERLSKAEFEKLGYPKPIVEHKAARERALHRFKNVGQK